MLQMSRSACTHCSTHRYVDPIFIRLCPCSCVLLVCTRGWSVTHEDSEDTETKSIGHPPGGAWPWGRWREVRKDWLSLSVWICPGLMEITFSLLRCCTLLRFSVLFVSSHLGSFWTGVLEIWYHGQRGRAPSCGKMPALHVCLSQVFLTDPRTPFYIHKVMCWRQK